MRGRAGGRVVGWVATSAADARLADARLNDGAQSHTRVCCCRGSALLVGNLLLDPASCGSLKSLAGLAEMAVKGRGFTLCRICTPGLAP